MSYVELESGIPGRGSLDGPCEVIVEDVQTVYRSVGGRATYQAVFRREQPQPARTKHRLIVVVMCTTPGTSPLTPPLALHDPSRACAASHPPRRRAYSRTIWSARQRGVGRDGCQGRGLSRRTMGSARRGDRRHTLVSEPTTPLAMAAGRSAGQGALALTAGRSAGQGAVELRGSGANLEYNLK